MTNADMVMEFHEVYGVPLAGTPGFPPTEREKLRIRLMEEELDELKNAMEQLDLVEIADGIADLLYVTYGTAIEYGIPIDEVFAEVHRSNLSKLGEDGKPVLREDGKVLKGPNFFMPDIRGILFPKVD